MHFFSRLPQNLRVPQPSRFTEWRGGLPERRREVLPACLTTDLSVSNTHSSGSNTRTRVSDTQLSCRAWKQPQTRRRTADAILDDYTSAPPKPETQTRIPKPESKNLEPETWNPEPGPRNPEPENPRPCTRNPEPETRWGRIRPQRGPRQVLGSYSRII